MIKDEIGIRMKTFYEEPAKHKLIRRTPVAIRIDGKAFHTFTKGMKKPFDENMTKSMQKTLKYLCENIQGCVFGYTQSDEITLILIDYQNINSSSWFDYEVQKITSVSASMATLAFNRFFAECVKKIENEYYEAWNTSKEDDKYIEVLHKAQEKGAMFDSRCFNIPKEEVANLLYWRQLDAIRNSVKSVGYANFKHNELNKKNCEDVKKMLLEKAIDWNEYSTDVKRGSCCIKKDTECKAMNGETIIRKKWAIDKEIPVFLDDFNYINRFIFK